MKLDDFLSGLAMLYLMYILEFWDEIIKFNKV